AARVRWPSTAGYWLQLFAMMGWTSLPWLWRVPKAALGVAGGGDPLVPPHPARSPARCLPPGRLGVSDGGGPLLRAGAGGVGGGGRQSWCASFSDAECGDDVARIATRTTRPRIWRPP